MPLSTLKKYLTVGLFSLGSSVVLAQGGMAVRADQQNLAIELSQVVPAEGQRTIAVELDGYDISAFSQVDGNSLNIQLQTPLAPGEHSLVVLMFLANGDIEQLLDQRLSVSSAGGVSSEWQANASLSSSYRMDQKENIDYAGVKHFSSNGGLSVRGREQRGKWQLETEVDALYDSVSENNPDSDEWALPHYRLAATYQGDATSSQLNLGNIAIAREDLLFSAFQRRGATASIAGAEGNYKIGVFGIQSEVTTRYDGDLLLPENSSSGITGITTTVAVLDEYLQVSAAYIDGETSLGGAGYLSFDDPTIYGGDSWNVAVDSRWLNRSVALHLEYAESEFDSDGIDIGLKAKADDATQAMLQLNSDGDLGAGWFDYWSGYLQYQSVGADYYSLGNLSIPGDLEMTRIFFQGGFYGIAIDMEWSQEKNNLDDEVFLATQTLERKGLALTYSPMNINPDGWLWGAIGSPSVMASFYRADHSQPDQEASIVGYDLDNRNDETGITLMFARPTWNWSVQHQLIEQEDYSVEVIQFGYLMYQPPSDTRNELTALQLGWVPNERASINLLMQWSKQSETDFNNDYRNRNYGVDAFLQIIPEKLTLMLNYNQGIDSSRLSQVGFIEDDFKSQFGNAQLSWHALQAYGSNPGIDFYVRGSYGKQDNRAFEQVNEQWSAHFGVELQWAAGGQ
ncbi:hypothetical protein [Oceanicoccus sp. KOV_DT_Chl]|uniref:hypothetical protein n=1 Tax=Oceanicoccus sp. KOV_DT_Chl TaxID=1904639 RepID=UPI0011AF849C|nr:hypothetical protein [Oceanicoccus sp. KOV_DT_Chl]